MSAEQSARTVRQADGLDPVRALQRVLYRSAKQEPERRPASRIRSVSTVLTSARISTLVPARLVPKPQLYLACLRPDPADRAKLGGGLSPLQYWAGRSVPVPPRAGAVSLLARPRELSSAGVATVELHPFRPGRAFLTPRTESDSLLHSSICPMRPLTRSLVARSALSRPSTPYPGQRATCSPSSSSSSVIAGASWPRVSGPRAASPVVSHRNVMFPCDQVLRSGMPSKTNAASPLRRHQGRSADHRGRLG